MRGETMTVQTDQTLTDWSRAATALGAETSIRIIAMVNKVARGIGASADASADAMPHVFLAVWRDGVSVEQASNMAVMTMHRREQSRQSDPDSVSIDAAETSADRDALEVAIQSSRDEVARTYGGGSRGDLLPLGEALEIAPKGARAIVEAVLTDSAKHSATRDYAGALYMPLKVSIVALAAGVARPRTKDASKALREAGCRAYGLVESLRDPSQTAETLSADALAWVTRDRRAYGGHGLAVWNNGARPEGIPYTLYRPLSDFQPDIFNGSTVRPLQPARGYRANTGSKGRKGPMAGQPSEGIAYGASGSMTPGTLTSATGGPNDSGLAAKRSVRSDAADLAAHEISDARSQGTPCKRPLISPESALCGCGPTKGQALIPHYLECVTSHLGQPDTLEILKVWTHALTVCPEPTQATLKDGTLSAIVSCGCGRKRGSLTAKGEHKAR